MICKNCGKKLPYEAPFCPVCGKEAEDYIASAQPSSGGKKSNTGLIICLVVMLVLIIGSAAVSVGVTAARLPQMLTAFLEMYPDNGEISEENQKLAAEYVAAIMLMERGQYDEALFMFQSLNNYRDSRLKFSECAYRAGMRYLDNGDYASALEYMQWMNATHNSQFFDRYYAEFCADEAAKADLYRAIEDYYAFLTEGMEEPDLLVAAADTLLQTYETRHFHEPKLQNLLHEYGAAIADLPAAAENEDPVTYLQARLRVHRAIDQLHAKFELLKGSNMLPMMSEASEKLENTIRQHLAVPVIRESLQTNFVDLLHSTEALSYDPQLRRHYLNVYNNTVYSYALTYQIIYYDRDGNVIGNSQPLTHKMVGAYENIVPMPLDNTLEWADLGVTFQVDPAAVDAEQSIHYAVRVVDEQGNPIYNAHVSFRSDKDTPTSHHHVYTTDHYGIAIRRQSNQEESFRVYLNLIPNFNYLEQDYEFPVDGWVHDVVVLPDIPDFSVTVVDTDGDPIPGVTMHLATTDVFTASKYGKTDKNGYVCWYDVDMSHTYKISGISFFGYVYIDEVRFEPGEHHITVVMEREKPKNDTPSFTVTVVDKEGNPIDGVVLYLTHSDVSSGDVYARTDKNGYACWYDVDMNHTYKVVRITKDGYATIREIHFAAGENHMVIVMEKEEDVSTEEE